MKTREEVLAALLPGAALDPFWSDLIKRAYDEGVAAGVEEGSIGFELRGRSEERAAIVAWLRHPDAWLKTSSDDGEIFAGVIERGAHRKEGGDIKHETQKSITAWAVETFGPSPSNLRIVRRALQEMGELGEVLARNDNDPKAIEEAADVYIVLVQMVERMGGSLQEAVDRKMKKNRARKWSTAGDGTGQHVEEGEQ